MAKTKEGSSAPPPPPAKPKKIRRVAKHLGALSALKSLGPIKLSAVLPFLSRSLQKSVCECAHNVVNKSDQLFKNNKRRKKLLAPKLLPHKTNLAKLTAPKLKAREREKLLIQTGGTVLSDVLSAAVPALIGLLAAV